MINGVVHGFWRPILVVGHAQFYDLFDECDPVDGSLASLPLQVELGSWQNLGANWSTSEDPVVELGHRLYHHDWAYL